ncbi:uncharacterized protein B0J16DRAFT_389818 [Fusarium flagelliforme]|uniref:Uncharacterized protein n=1 Tax=Fusarium flagelliforme TaxID=2675880 RepID=A0A395MA70_9HYPO|nr:uncharacterized protein B0J16DRAFT_389818 [Fusarium flagelliforme]KAH7173937.1 hypothetical protein B0J16DRAFT_389818 [Fusarium flagelliforme]RFN44778.1 hypothetical protein FIE12Z_10972 [Fusarium flagelliforme]
MSIRTLRSRSELQMLITEYPLVIVAAVINGFEPADMEFERLAQSKQEYSTRVAFAKFIVEEVSELAEDFQIHEAATIIAFCLCEKDKTFAGFDPPKWEEMVMTAIRRVL